MKRIKDMLAVFTRDQLLFIFVISGLAFIMRYFLSSFVTGDYTYYTSVWFDELKAGGGLKAIGMELTRNNYNPPYTYIIAFLTYIPRNSLYSIKAVSIIFDYALAYYVARIVMLKKGHGINHGIFAYVLILFLPTVISNSAIWGQCDGIYTLFLVMCLYYLLKDKPLKAMVFFAISFTFKLQAIFLGPFILIMLLMKKMKWVHVLAAPVVYAISILPAFLMGRSLGDLIGIYLGQASDDLPLAWNAHNFYTWFGGYYDDGLVKASLVFAASMVVIAAYFVCRKKFALGHEMMISLAFASALIVPFILPRMHERYFYPADILAVLFWFCFPKKFYVPLIVVGCSQYVVMRFLYGTSFVDNSVLAIPMMVVVYKVVEVIYQMVRGAGTQASAYDGANK
jgi:Gpi18-like mannosyltransferase